MKDDELCFPKGFCYVNEVTFKDLFEKNKEWVDFTMTDMKDPKGLFLKWQEYCIRKQKQHG